MEQKCEKLNAALTIRANEIERLNKRLIDMERGISDADSVLQSELEDQRKKYNCSYFKSQKDTFTSILCWNIVSHPEWKKSKIEVQKWNEI